LRGGPVGPPARWAAKSNVEVGQTIYPINRGRYEGRGKKGARDKVTKRRRGNGTGEGKRPGTLSEEGWLYLDICAEIPEFL